MVNGSLVFQIKFCGKSPALRVAAKRVSGDCPHDSKVEDNDVATQLIEMKMPRRLTSREAIHATCSIFPTDDFLDTVERWRNGLIVRPSWFQVLRPHASNMGLLPAGSSGLKMPPSLAVALCSTQATAAKEKNVNLDKGDPETAQSQ